MDKTLVEKWPKAGKTAGQTEVERGEPALEWGTPSRDHWPELPDDADQWAEPSRDPAARQRQDRLQALRDEQAGV